MSPDLQTFCTRKTKRVITSQSGVVDDVILGYITLFLQSDVVERLLYQILS